MGPLDFERVVVIGLRRRPERLRQFWKGLPNPWPFRQPQHVAAIDGAQFPLPGWYAQSRPQDRGRLVRPRVRNAPDLSGAWGCLRSHHRVWEAALNDGVNSLLVFEDDAVFCRQFNARLIAFLDVMPDDWDQIYFGGQHLGVDGLWPQPINEYVLRGRYVNRTHAYGIRQPFLDEVYRRFLEPWASQQAQMFHLDHQLCQLHRAFDKTEHRHLWNVYCPREWLVGQAENISDVKIGTPQREHWWQEFEICPEGIGEHEQAATVPA